MELMTGTLLKLNIPAFESKICVSASLKKLTINFSFFWVPVLVL
jgi:hypothetical protein